MRVALSIPATAVARAPRATRAAALVCAALAALPLCGATALAQNGAPSQGAAGRAAPPLARHRDAFFIAGAASGVAANAIWRIHAGSLVGQDLWLGRDKALHAGTASSLTLAGIGAGVRPWVAATTVCLAGGAFELTEVRASGKDATVNCVSAATAWGWSALVRRWRGGH